ncbi:MAG TPA: hypothetical protein V6C86_21585 [Oculatellaceae cyanobacterium]
MEQASQVLTPNESVASEVAVRLEQLDFKLKAIVRMKVREFIHLTPEFQHIPTIGLDSFSQRPLSAPMRIGGEYYFDIDSVRELEIEEKPLDSDCPNRPVRFQVRRRPMRAFPV